MPNEGKNEEKGTGYKGPSTNSVPCNNLLVKAAEAVVEGKVTAEHINDVLRHVRADLDYEELAKGEGPTIDDAYKKLNEIPEVTNEVATYILHCAQCIQQRSVPQLRVDKLPSGESKFGNQEIPQAMSTEVDPLDQMAMIVQKNLDAQERDGIDNDSKNNKLGTTSPSDSDDIAKILISLASSNPGILGSECQTPTPQKASTLQENPTSPERKRQRRV